VKTLIGDNLPDFILAVALLGSGAAGLYYPLSNLFQFILRQRVSEIL
jgi:hypothetical protein